MLPAEDEFITPDTFIRLSWSIYFDANHSIDAKYYKDLESLISTTSLNKISLIHTLYYLYLLVNHKPFLYQSSNYKLSSFQSSSRMRLLSSSNKKTFNELYELIVVLFMISNKANDDSSYTMKTWSNLTPLTNSILKKKELVVLKKIQYNVFLKSDEYLRWCSQLYEIGVHYGIIYQSPSTQTQSTIQSSPLSSNLYHVQPIPQNFTYTQQQQQQQQSTTPAHLNYPLTPKSPVYDVSYLPLPSMVPQQPSAQPVPQAIPQTQPVPQVQPVQPVQQPQIIPQYPIQSNKRSISQTDDYTSPYKKQHSDSINLLLTPIKTNSYEYQNLYDQPQQQQQQQTQSNYYTNNGYTTNYVNNNESLNTNYMNYYPQQAQPQPQPAQQIPQLPQQIYHQQQQPIYGYQTQYPHPPNCACCQLTNYTNSYHSSLKSMVKL